MHRRSRSGSGRLGVRGSGAALLQRVDRYGTPMLRSGLPQTRSADSPSGRSRVQDGCCWCRWSSLMRSPAAHRRPALDPGPLCQLVELCPRDVQATRRWLVRALVAQRPRRGCRCSDRRARASACVAAPRSSGPAPGRRAGRRAGPAPRRVPHRPPRGRSRPGRPPRHARAAAPRASSTRSSSSAAAIAALAAAARRRSAGRVSVSAAWCARIRCTRSARHRSWLGPGVHARRISRSRRSWSVAVRRAMLLGMTGAYPPVRASHAASAA